MNGRDTRQWRSGVEVQKREGRGWGGLFARPPVHLPPGGGVWGAVPPGRGGGDVGYRPTAHPPYPAPSNPLTNPAIAKPV